MTSGAKQKGELKLTCLNKDVAPERTCVPVDACLFQHICEEAQQHHMLGCGASTRVRDDTVKHG